MSERRKQGQEQQPLDDPTLVVWVCVSVSDGLCGLVGDWVLASSARGEIRMSAVASRSSGGGSPQGRILDYRAQIRCNG